MSHEKDLDYLTISARIHAMENRLLNHERMERMIEARELSEAAKVLTECGYEDLGQVTAGGIEEMLSKAQTDLFHDLSSAVGNRALLDVFRCGYDYHNAKVLVKGEARRICGAAPTSSAGVWPVPGRPWVPPATPSCPTSFWTGPTLRSSLLWPVRRTASSWRATWP